MKKSVTMETVCYGSMWEIFFCIDVLKRTIMGRGAEESKLSLSARKMHENFGVT